MAWHARGLKDITGGLFGKSKEVVEANWEQVVEQIRYLLAQIDSAADKYEMSEITFELGFSAGWDNRFRDACRYHKYH